MILPTPSFVIERHPFGWLLCSSRGGLPMDALSECQNLFPQNAVVNIGIGHHFRHAYDRADIIFCVTTADNEALWRKEIESRLAHLSTEERWWLGLDVGASATCIFHTLCSPAMRTKVASFLSSGAIPRDADDFGRCQRLLEKFPEWRNRLDLVAAAFPESKWSEIVRLWPQLEGATRGLANELLGQV